METSQPPAASPFGGVGGASAVALDNTEALLLRIDREIEFTEVAAIHDASARPFVLSSVLNLVTAGRAGPRHPTPSFPRPTRTRTARRPVIRGCPNTFTKVVNEIIVVTSSVETNRLYEVSAFAQRLLRLHNIRHDSMFTVRATGAVARAPCCAVDSP